MDFKPNEFFIGLVEFITVLLPGAVLAIILLMIESYHPIISNRPLYLFAFSEDTTIIFWVLIVFSSFGLGYFLSSIASGLDPLYDWIRKQFSPYNEDLEKGFLHFRNSDDRRKHYLEVYKKIKKKSDWVSENDSKTDENENVVFEGYCIVYTQNILRRLLAIIFKLDFRVKIDKSYEEARKILNAQPASVRNATNTYKWAGTVLEAHFPSISDQAIRIMSASKFFRSMVVVTLIFLVLQVFGQLPKDYWIWNLLILLLSFREYVVQRQKSVQKTYQSIVTLTYYKKDSIEI